MLKQLGLGIVALGSVALLYTGCGTGIDPNAAYNAVAAATCAQLATGWSGVKQAGATSTFSYNYGVSSNTSGSVYAGGSTSGALHGNVLTGTDDSSIIKYSVAGERLWTRQFGVAGKAANINAVATDASDNAYVTGYTTGGLEGAAATGINDFFLAKYDGAGTRLWLHQLGVASKTAIGKGVAVDASGNVYAVGRTNGSLDGNAMTGTENTLLVKYDSAGNRIWTRQLAVAGRTLAAASVTVDTSGNVYLAGSTTGALAGNTLVGNTELLLAKYDSSGTLQTAGLGW